MRRPKHTTAKARSKAAAARIWVRHWFNGPEGKALFRSMMDQVMGKALTAIYGVEVVITNGKLARITCADGSVREFQ